MCGVTIWYKKYRILKSKGAGTVNKLANFHKEALLNTHTIVSQRYYFEVYIMLLLFSCAFYDSKRYKY